MSLLAVVSRRVPLNHLVEGLVVHLQELLLDLHQVNLQVEWRWAKVCNSGTAELYTTIIALYMYSCM